MSQAREAGSFYDGQQVILLAILASVAGITFIWNAYAKIQWALGLEILAVIPLTLLGTSIVLDRMPGMRGTAKLRRTLAEIFFYLSVWPFLALVMTRFSYLFATLNFPLQDDLLHRLDHLIGLDWHSYYEFVIKRPFLSGVLFCAYASFLSQWIVAIVIFSASGMGKRNLELVLLMIISILIIVPISGLVPAFGPNEAYGIKSDWHDILLSLRTGTHTPLMNAGIVTFPSLHTAGGILYVYVQRRLKWSFRIFALLNIAMLISIPVFGLHYFTDMIAGALVAIAAIFLTRWILREAPVREHAEAFAQSFGSQSAFGRFFGSKP